MKSFLLSLFALVGTFPSYAQKVNLQKWVEHNIDSLQNNKVDTIIYYHAYCGECVIQDTPPIEGNHPSYCETENGWVQIENIIIYQQNGRYYTLNFNCAYPPIKKALKDAHSVEYFISIIPVLNKRDKFGEALQKKHKFNPPIVIDGGYEEAFIYLKSIKQHVFMKEEQKTDEGWKSYFWIDKQTKLFSLLKFDILSKD